ncbi:MAG: endonuclease MutS2, partial [Bacteroidetes bacterium]
IDKQDFEWINAIHPLLYLTHKNINKEIVPLHVKLDEEQRILVISGPNAGGKSVCLKTIGLLQYMLQCGLLIPVKEGSAAGIFENLFIDIGDEQSLENDLSTYSSHLLNMKHFLLNANNNTLFLIDEFGTGTEPVLGGAIAESVLERLNEKEAYGVVTTHYSNLKLMAKPGNGIINGAMMFDTKAMKPLYRLKMGNPGSSFAFEIARNIGFPKQVLKRAENKTGKKQLDFDEQLQQLETEKRELAKKQQKYNMADDFLSEMIDKYEKLLKDIKSKKSEIISNAGIEAARLLKSSNKLIENTIREIREADAEKEKTKKLRKQLEEKSKELEKRAVSEKKTFAKVKTPETTMPEPTKSSPIVKGDIVKILDQGVSGEVIERKGEDIIVEFNSVRLRTTVDKLEKAKSGEKLKISRSNRRGRQLMDQLSDKMASFDLKADVRGKRGEEALSEIKQYIDDAILLSISEVKILHGTGHGILRQLIHDYLKTIDQIKSFGDERVELGGHGVTVVKFR